MYIHAAVAQKAQGKILVLLQCNSKPREVVGIFAITGKAGGSLSVHYELCQLKQAELQNFLLTRVHNKSSPISCSSGKASTQLSRT